MKSATVSVIGRPSAGKSTMVNTICEMKVSITSPTPQTTRNKIRGIYTDQRGQLVFLDTPGYHLSEKTINKKMQDVTLSALTESDIILYILDGKRAQKKEEETLADLIKEAKVPLVIAINKKDVMNKADHLIIIDKGKKVADGTVDSLENNKYYLNLRDSSSASNNNI